MGAPYSNSEKKASPHAEGLSLRRLWKRVPRANLRAAPLDPLRVEPGQRPVPLAEVSSHWPILRTVPSQACAHGYRQRAGRIRSLHCSLRLAPSLLLRTQKQVLSVVGNLWARSRALLPSTPHLRAERLPASPHSARTAQGTNGLPRAGSARGGREGASERTRAFTCQGTDNYTESG